MGRHWNPLPPKFFKKMLRKNIRSKYFLLCVPSIKGPKISSVKWMCLEAARCIRQEVSKDSGTGGNVSCSPRLQGKKGNRPPVLTERFASLGVLQ